MTSLDCVYNNFICILRLGSGSGGCAGACAGLHWSLYKYIAFYLSRNAIEEGTEAIEALRLRRGGGRGVNTDSAARGGSGGRRIHG